MKDRLRSAQLTVGAQLSLEDSAVVEIFGRAGYDYVLIDAEHGAATPQVMKSMLQAGQHTDTVVLARVLRLDVELIRLYLDLGSPGVACPFINAEEEAKRLVAACRYPPEGIRGYGPRRAGNYGFDADAYYEQANDSMICIAMIETETAIQNIDQITAVEGLDAVLIGRWICLSTWASLATFPVRSMQRPNLVCATPARPTVRPWVPVVTAWTMPSPAGTRGIPCCLHLVTR